MSKEETEDTWFGRHNITKLEEQVKQLEGDVDFLTDELKEIRRTLEQNNIRLKVKRQ